MASSGGETVKCCHCGLEYNREERCPRTLLCGHTSCTSCLEALITQGERRCPTCRRPFFSLSTVLIPKNSEVLRGLGESSKSSSKTPLRSSLSADSSFERSTTSRGRSSALSTPGSSQSLGSSFEVGGAVRERNAGSDQGVSIPSTEVSSPPPLPSSAPPSLDETFEGHKVSSKKITGASGVDGEGSDGCVPRLSSLQRSSSADQASRGSHTSLTYAFPTIRTKLNVSSSSSRTDSEASSSGGKTELRPAKSLPPISSSSSSQSMPSASSSSAYRSSLPLSSSLRSKMEDSPASSSAEYTSPFSKTSSSSSSSSSFSRNTFRVLPGSHEPTLQATTVSDSFLKGKEGSGVTSSALSDSMNSSGLSRSMPSFYKLESKLRVPLSPKKHDEPDLGISKWKVDTTSLLRKADDNGVASRTEGQDSGSSGTPRHVLRMCRTITSRSRPAVDDAAPAMTTTTDNSNTSFPTYSKVASSSSSSISTYSFSSSTTTSKNTRASQESSQFGQASKPLTESDNAGRLKAVPEMPPDDAPSSGGENDAPNHFLNLPSSFVSDGITGDASEGSPSSGSRVGMKARGGEVEDAERHATFASPPSERSEEESKETRKLVPSASLSARLGARARFLATAIDEMSEEEDAGGGKTSAGVNQGRTWSAGKLYKPDRQGAQRARPHAFLGARISARVSYLSGGRSGEESEASRSVFQAEDSTEIDPQRMAGRSWTKRDAAAEGLHRTSSAKEDGASGAPSAHLGTTEGGDKRDAEAKLIHSFPASALPEAPRRTPGAPGDKEATGNRKNAKSYIFLEQRKAGSQVGDNRYEFQSQMISAGTKDSEDDGASSRAFSMRQRGSRGVFGRDGAPAYELSQHSLWRRHRAIDSRSKEELSDSGCVAQATSTSKDSPEAAGATASTPCALSAKGSSSADSSVLNQADSASGGDDDRPTKHNEKSEGTPPFSRSEAGTENAIFDTMDGSPGTPREVLERRSSSVPPQASSDPYPWRKKWRSVMERTSSASTRPTQLEVKNTPLSEASKQPEESTPLPRSPAAKAKALGEAGIWRGRSSGTPLHSRTADTTTADGPISPSYRASSGTLAIGRVSSLQESDDDLTETQKVLQDAARTDPGNADEHTPLGRMETRGQGRGVHTEWNTLSAGNTAVKNAALSLRGDDARLGSSGGDAGKHPNRIPDAASQTRTVPRGAAEFTARPEQPARGAAGEETQEDINIRLRRARERLRATTTTPTEENVSPSPARTNLAYLLARVQSTEPKRMTRADEDEDEDEEVFDEDSQDERDVHTQQHSLSSGGTSTVNRPGDFEAPAKSIPDEGIDQTFTRDEPDSVTQRLPPRSEQSGNPRGEKMTPTGQQEEDESKGSDEVCIDASYEGHSEGTTEEYEPGVGLCSSHGLMLHLYCEDCQEWVCNDCLRVLHRPSPRGSCRIISAAEGVTQMKVSHASFLTSRTNTLEYFREELGRITEQCDSSIRLHKNNLRRLEKKMEEEQRFLRGIESMRFLAQEKKRQVDYWGDVLQENLSRIDESSSSQDVLRAVQESSGDILHKAMEAVSLVASDGVLLSPPN